MTTDPEILARLERIEKLLSLLGPETQPIQHEIRMVKAQGWDLVEHFKKKYKRQRRAK